MNKTLIIALMCAWSVCYTKINAQCGTNVVGTCYSGINSLEQIAVDICPDNPGDIVNITFTGGSIEGCCDPLVVYTGAAGTGSTGTIVYNNVEADGDLTGLFVNGTTAGECLHVYINSDFSNTCANVGAVPASFDISCVAPPPSGYWINNAAAPAPNYSTCQDVVITDATSTIYDSGGPFGNSLTENNVVTVCPDNACTVDVTIVHNLTGGSINLYDGPSRNNGDDGSPDFVSSITGVGTTTYTTTGPCFSYYSALFGDPGYQIDYTIATSGCASPLTTKGDHCYDAVVLSASGSTAMTSIDATSGPVYSGGTVIEGDCDPDLIGDGCTATVENTVYATYTSCAAGGLTNIILTDTGCTPGTQSPQYFVYSGTCGNLTFVDCASSGAGGTALGVNFVAAPSTTYYLVIDGFRGNECNFGIEVLGCIASCTPDAGAISIP